MRSNLEKTVRKNAAELVKECRAMFPTLRGNWTRREWNAQCKHSGRAYVRNMLHFHKVNP